MIQFTIKRNTPSKKNNKRVFCRGKYPVVLPSELHEDWHSDALPELIIDRQRQKKASLSRFPIEKAYYVILQFYRSTHRIYDVTNAGESIMDLLVDAGVLKDDNFKVTPKVFPIHGDKDKENPRCEVFIFTEFSTEAKKQICDIIFT